MKRTTPALVLLARCVSAKAANPWKVPPSALGPPCRFIMWVTLIRPWLSIVTCKIRDVRTVCFEKGRRQTCYLRRNGDVLGAMVLQRSQEYFPCCFPPNLPGSRLGAVQQWHSIGEESAAI